MIPLHASLYVGIDVCQARLDVHTRPTEHIWTAPNTPAGIQALLTRLHPLQPTLVVVEATGGLEELLVTALRDHGIAVSILNPRQIRDFARATGTLAKTDRLDAALLAHYAQVLQPVPRPVPDAATQRLKALVTRRQQLIEMCTAERNRLHRLPALCDSLHRILTVLRHEIATVEALIQATIHAAEPLQTRAVLLQSTPGIGAILAATILALLPELGQLPHKPLAALVGVAPFTRESGARHGPRRVRGGRGPVRAAFFMAAFVGIRHNPTLKAFYTRLLAAGKCKKVALTACMHKLLIILNTMVTKQTPWQPARAVLS